VKKIVTLVVLSLMFTALAWSQELTQTVRGTVLDIDSQQPLIGANVIIPGTVPLVGTVTDENGEFRLKHIPIGRISLEVSYLGYESKTVPNIVVNSGKEVVLSVPMEESVLQMEAVEVTPERPKGEALNDMSVISARSISTEETNRYAGGYDDPTRILSNFAGVTSPQDGRSVIIVRGNSPKYIQWRLEGVEITNPSHFADQNTVSSGPSALNNKLLTTSDFYTGAFSPEYGNALSGIYDIRLRPGNNENFEASVGFGLLGTDVMLEGPFREGYDGSYLVNYRYSTISLIADLGIVDIGGVPRFQDAAFKVVLPTEKSGRFSIFGLGGLSSMYFEDITPDVWRTPGDRGMSADIREDYEKESYLANTGINHILPLDDDSYLRTSLSYSAEGISDDVYESEVTGIYDSHGEFVRDSVLNKRVSFRNRLEKSTSRAAITYSNKVNAKHKIQAGAKYSLFQYDISQSRLRKDYGNRMSIADIDENVGVINNFLSWKYRFDESVTLVSGVHNVNVLFNNKSTLEPRIALNWELSNTDALHAGYGKHSTMESIHHYFARIEEDDGSITEPNKDLDLLKADHFVLGYEKRFTPNVLAKIEAYYQGLYDLPVENVDTSYYATINEGMDYRYVDLVNQGTGQNLGIEITLERFFKNNYYYLINGSVYNSRYTSLEGIRRNTRYNGNYLMNLLIGKEYDGLGKKRNQTLALNAKLFFGGGHKIIPLLRDEHGNVAVDPADNRYWDYDRAYERGLEDVYSIILSASYKWNKLNATHELFLTLDNVTNTKGKLAEFYDPTAPDDIGYATQFGFYPNLMYRVYF